MFRKGATSPVPAIRPGSRSGKDNPLVARQRLTNMVVIPQTVHKQFQYLKGAYRKDREGLCIRACSDRARGNGFKLKEGRFRLDVRKKFFTVGVVRHWNRLPREAVDVPSVVVFKGRLDAALSNLV